MKKIVASLFTAVALVCAAPAMAQQAQPDPAAVAAAKDLFDSMNYRAVMHGMMQQMAQGLAGSMRAGATAAINNNAKLSAEEKQKALAKMEADLPAAVNTMQTVMNDPGMIDEIIDQTVPIYARNFSADELKQIAAFYRTPVGQKMLANMPKLMGEGMQVGQQIVARRLGPMLQKAQQEQK
ncbi:DUF2059 domain-containing protein [Duganella callida]|uniref:DUF2059 domain-containing protein n=1 Tax=Duganella callida TaxID=2561932 RepID=A0A4Y9SAH7_9BURK|nr:DUF2059 domain-containing protein [Duganella callida]TFW18879.1 DUF2059 domain-containing protein [Duganella callida]